MKLMSICCIFFLLISCRNPFKDNNSSIGSQSGDFENYTFEQSVVCFCPSPPAGHFFKLTVRDSQIVTAKNTQTGEQLEAREFSFFKTIPELIELVHSIDEESVAQLDVTYNDKHNYPSYLYIDYSTAIADEEIGYRSRNYERD